MAKRTGVAAWLVLQVSVVALVPGEDDAPVAFGVRVRVIDVTADGVCGGVPRLFAEPRAWCACPGLS